MWLTDANTNTNSSPRVCVCVCVCARLVQRSSFPHRRMLNSFEQVSQTNSNLLWTQRSTDGWSDYRPNPCCEWKQGGFHCRRPLRRRSTSALRHNTNLWTFHTGVNPEKNLQEHTHHKLLVLFCCCHSCNFWTLQLSPELTYRGAELQ